MENLDISVQIAQIDKQMSELRAQIPAQQARYDDWFRQSQVKCDFSLKSKQQRCLDDKAYKLSEANKSKQILQNLNNQINALQATKNTLIDRQKANNDATVNLSTQGLSNEALIQQALGSSQALQVKAEAEAEAIKREAEAEAQAIQEDSASSTMRKNIIIGAVVLVVVVVTIMVIKAKMKKKK